uniref:Neuron navigator 1 n=1 Tax=Dicentrarchus labrax TaxID=13489 RepID=A0A8P4K3Y7_DICLA
MAAKRAKSGVPQSTQRGELKVYRAGSSDGRLPVPSNLRKQRSMTNLAVLTDAEKKLHLYEPKWCDDMAKPGAGQTKMGGAPLSRNLSKSEHSLFQGKPKPFSPLAAPSALSKQSRIPRGPYAEVKPLSKAPEDGKSDDEILSSKAKANAKKQGAGAGGESGSKGQGEEGGDKPFLKVDPELVVTVLGDLEQLLFSQMLDPESQRKRTVQNVLDLRQNLEDTMSSLRGSQLSHSNVGYDSDETNARSISSLSNRSSPLSWRHGQSSPRLQAGDAPSSTGGGYQGSKTGSQYTAHTMPARCSSRLSSTSRIELIEGLDVDESDLKSGYLSDTDLGKSLPDDDEDNLANGWDESSSISSGLSDGDGEGSENLSSEEFNASSSLNSLPSTPLGSRRNSSVMVSCNTVPNTPKSERPLDKSKMSIKAAGLQRSRSDAGRDHHHHGEHRKPPSGLVKPTAGASFGYKKPPTATGTATVMTAGGATISSGSATVGKTPKSSGIPVKPVGGGPPSGRKNSFDASSEQSFLGPNARNSIQYRSLPRPAKSSTLSVIGRPAPRPVSGTIDPSLLSLKPMPMASTSPRVKEHSSCSSKMANRTSTGPVNQTDREKEKERAKAKAVGADIDCGSLKGEESQSTGESTVKLHGLRRTSSSKYPELSSPTTPRFIRIRVRYLGVLYACVCRCVCRCVCVCVCVCVFLYSTASYSFVFINLFCMIVAPISSGTPRISRSNSIGPPSDSACDLYGSSPLGSSMSLADRPKSMMRCGSFREPGDDGEPVQPGLPAGESPNTQIRKLRRELESSQEKVADLTMQLSANANLVAAFEQSLALMTARLQTLSVSSEQKDSELTELKDTIEILKVKNTEAQEIIHGALNNPDITPKELLINRQNSSESISSLTSTTSHSSMGSLKEQEAKKKKKKRGEVADDKVVSELRTELWEKERKLTDIRLEALSSAHHLEQLQEAMNNMQVCVISSFSLFLHKKKSSCSSLVERPTNMILTSWFQPVCCPVCQQEVKQQDFFVGTVRVNGRMDWPMLDSAVSQAFKVYIAKVDPTSSLGLSTDSIYSYSMGHIKRVLGGEAPETQPSRCMSRGPSGITVALKGLKEKCVDSLVFETLIPKPMMQHYISLLLKHRRLILSGPSGTGKSYLASRLAEYLVDRSAREVTEGIVVTFNMHRQSCKDLQLYLSNQANQIDRETSTSEIPLVVILDDIHEPASISELVNGALTCKYHKCPYIIGTSNQPVKMIANHGLHLSFRMVTFSNNVEPANGFLVRYLHRKLMESEDEKNLTNEDLIRVLDWVPKLWYHLHTFLEKHSTSDFLIGPCFFLSCPVTVDEFQSWFIDLWNHSIIPYLQEGAKDGIKVHGQKAVWEDPVEWVRGTLPWPSAQQDQAKLFHLPPPSIGSSSPGQSLEERPHKETPPSSMESDPLMAMLLKLQEAANYIESPDKEDPSLPKL